MANWKYEANKIMRDMCISMRDRLSILRYADTFAPNANNQAKFNRACRKARELL